MNQSKNLSFLEALINNLIGLITAWATWQFIIIEWVKLLGLDANNFTFMAVTLVNGMFTIVGIIRTYGCRRVFNYLMNERGGD